MFKQLLLLALAIASVSANLSFTDCGSRSQVRAFRLRGCDATPCDFVRGGEYYGEMEVVAAGGSAVLPFRIRAILGFPIPPVTIFEGNACDELVGTTCPIHEGQDITARIYMEIPSALPPVTNINVEAEVRNGLNQIEVCIRIPVNVR